MLQQFAHHIVIIKILSTRTSQQLDLNTSLKKVNSKITWSSKWIDVIIKTCEYLTWQFKIHIFKLNNEEIIIRWKRCSMVKVIPLQVIIWWISVTSYICYCTKPTINSVNHSNGPDLLRASIPLGSNGVFIPSCTKLLIAALFLEDKNNEAWTYGVC